MDMRKGKWKKNVNVLICLIMLFGISVSGFVPNTSIEVKAADSQTPQPPDRADTAFDSIKEVRLVSTYSLSGNHTTGYNGKAGTDIELIPEFYDGTSSTPVTDANITEVTWKCTGTGARVNGTVLSTTQAGIVTLTPVIKGGANGNKPKTLSPIEITMEHVPVDSIKVDTFTMGNDVKSAPTMVINAGDTIDLTSITNVLSASEYAPTYKNVAWYIEKANKDLSYSEDVAVDPITKQELKRVRIASDATVSTTGGVLTAKRRGQFVLKATIKNGNAQTGSNTDTVKWLIVKVKYVPVVRIERVPPTVVAGVDTRIIGALTGRNEDTKLEEAPTYQEIKWEISNKAANTAGATITPDGSLKTKNVGELTVRATVPKGLTESAPFVDDFNIKVIENHIPVVNVKDVSTRIIKGVDRRIEGVVEPATATNNVIVWKIVDQGTTDAKITEKNQLTVTKSGKIKVMAEIYYSEGNKGLEARFGPFTIEIADSFIPVTNIVNIPSSAIINKYLTLNATVYPANADYTDIEWSIMDAGTTGAVISSDQFFAKNYGTATVRATIKHGKSETEDFVRDFDISVDKVFIPVTGISKVPTEGKMMQAITLSGTVSPGTATNKEIVWSIASAGATEATIDDKGKLTANMAGTVIVRATIKNGLGNGGSYTQDFPITITAVYVPVKSITDTIAKTMLVNETLALQATVEPTNATNKSITWSIADKGTTNATLSGNQLRATDAGTVKIRATIKNGKTASTDFTKDYSIKVNDLPHTAVKKINGLPEKGWVNRPLQLSGTVDPTNATATTITWSIKDKGTTNATLNGSTLTAKKAGEVKLTATVENGKSKGTAYTQDFAVKFDYYGGEGADIKGNQINLYGKLGGSAVASAKLTNTAVEAALSANQEEPIVIVNLSASRSAVGFSVNVEQAALETLIRRNVKSFIIQSNMGSMTLSAAGLQQVLDIAKTDVSFRVTRVNATKLPKAARSKAAGKAVYAVNIYYYKGNSVTAINKLTRGSVYFSVPAKTTRKLTDPLLASLSNRGVVKKYKTSVYDNKTKQVSLRIKTMGNFIVTNR